MSRSTFIEANSQLFDQLTNSDLLFENAPCGFISFLPDGTILRVNQTLAGWLGYSFDEIYEKSFTELLVSGSAMYWKLITCPLLSAEGSVNEVLFTIAGANHTFDVLFSAVIYSGEHSEVTVLNATLQDIRERKKYEAELLESKRYAEDERSRFESMADAIPNLVWTINPEGRVYFINQRMRDYFSGYSATDFDGFRGIADEDRAAVMRAWVRAHSRGTAMELEARMKAVNKPAEWFLIRIVPFYNRAGWLELWFGSATNINRQKMLQLANYSSLSASLSTAYKTIDSNNEMFLKIAFNQSHMIRKPLANIMGLLALLRELPASQEIKDMIDLLGLSTAELDQLVKDIVKHTEG